MEPVLCERPWQSYVTATANYRAGITVCGQCCSVSVTVPEPVTASVPAAILLPVVETMRMWVVVTMLAVSVNFIN
jgi:hypothetical protein